MLKVKLNCPVCGQSIGARSVDGHLEKAHELTGVVTLRLHPVSPYVHDPEPEPVPEPEKEPEPELKPKRKRKPKPPVELPGEEPKE